MPDMRATSIVVAAAAVAGMVQAGQETTQVAWHYGMPDTGLLPSYGRFEWFTRMGERHGGNSELSMQSYGISVPFLDPRKTGWGETMVNLQFDAKVTILNTGGSLDLANEEMYNFALPITFITPMPNGRRWTYGLAPEVASDSDAAEKGFDLAAYAFYTVKQSEHFTYSLGLAASPRFAEYGVLPMMRFEWTPNDRWTVSLAGYQLQALYHATDRLSFGPFLASRGGIWSVGTERGDRIFRVRSLVAGAMFEYDFSRPGQTKRIITAAVGSTLTTNAQFLERNGRKDAYDNHHYKPALYISAGVDFRF